MAELSRWLCISDLQIPYEAPRALEFCLSVQKWFRIPKENILCVGDETDQFHGSQYKKDPNAPHTPKGELKEACDRLKRWYKCFPHMKLATSNHGLRWLRKATEAEIPEDLLRSYQDVINAPPTWQWKDRWIIEAKHRFMITHGMEYGGMYAFRQAPTVEGMSVAFGHLHSSAGIAYVRSGNLDIWGQNVGCLIDIEAHAFKYGKWNRWKPNLGVGVILEDGAMPAWVPYTG